MWQVVRARVIAEETMCSICRGTEFIDVPRHPRSRSVDHIVALVEGGARYDRRNLSLAHYGCNASKGASRHARPSVPDRSEEW